MILKTLSLTLVTCVLASCAGTNETNSQAEKASIGLTTPAPVSDTAHEPRHFRRHHRGTGAGAGAIAAVVGARAVPSGGEFACNDAQFVSLQKQFTSGARTGDQEVDVCGKVTDVFSERDTRSGLHGYYDLAVAPGVTIEIVSDLGRMNAPAWPWVKIGDYSYVQGRYYYDDASSQGIDWTHHGTSSSWPTAGYVVVNGTEYF